MDDLFRHFRPKRSNEKRAKVVTYLQSKGYELDLIIDALNEIKKDIK